MNDWMRLLNLQEEVRQKDAEIKRLKTLLSQAIFALDVWKGVNFTPSTDALIDDFRKATK